jgi:hypothetical protein
MPKLCFCIAAGVAAAAVLLQRKAVLDIVKDKTLKQARFACRYGYTSRSAALMILGTAVRDGCSCG